MGSKLHPILIHLSDDCVKVLKTLSFNADVSRKSYIENVLETIAQKHTKKQLELFKGQKRK